MGLHALSDDTLSIHCTKPSCAYHNCANWEPYQRCTVHEKFIHTVVPKATMQERLKGIVAPEVLEGIGDTIIVERTSSEQKDGSTRQIPIDHPDIVWLNEQEVCLPVCECGSRTTLKVGFTDEELEADNIAIKVRDPQNPANILRIERHPMALRHIRLAELLRERGNVYAPKAQEPPVEQERADTQPLPPLAVDFSEVLLSPAQLDQVVAHLRTLVK